jgi:hypothetical protein
VLKARLLTRSPRRREAGMTPGSSARVLLRRHGSSRFRLRSRQLIQPVQLKRRKRRARPTAWLRMQSRSNLSGPPNSQLTGKLTGKFF